MSRPLKFLHLTTFYPPYSFGGDALFLYRLCHALGDAGHHVDVVHCVDSYHLFHPGPPPIAVDEHPNVRRHELRSGLGWLSPLLTQQTGHPLLKKGQDPPAVAGSRLRRHPLPQHLAPGPGRPGDGYARQAGGQALHHARALARLSDARALEVRSCPLREARVPALCLARASSAATMALHRAAAANEPARGRVHRPEPIHRRDARRAGLLAAVGAPPPLHRPRGR